MRVIIAIVIVVHHWWHRRSSPTNMWGLMSAGHHLLHWRLLIHMSKRLLETNLTRIGVTPAAAKNGEISIMLLMAKNHLVG
jgi:hypothetical protein